MKRTIVTPAGSQPAALSELKDWLGITTPGDDAQLSALLRTALDLCEDFTGTMPVQQTCEELLPVTGTWTKIAARPVQAILAVEGVPAEGARFALPAGNYAIELDADGGGRVLVHNSGAAGRIAVRFIAGLAADWAALPPAAVAAMWRPWRQLRLA